MTGPDDVTSAFLTAGTPPLEPYFKSPSVTIYNADSRTAWHHLDVQADAIVTSPPYWGLRDYGVDGQLGQESEPREYVANLTDWMHGYGTTCMKPEGSMWLNLGDTYVNKSLAMIPEQVALALTERGWVLRNKVVWAKPNGMSAGTRDRLDTKWEYLFHFVRSRRYRYDIAAVKEAVDRSKRPQMRRALELADAAGLTDDHIAALRSASMDDTQQGQATRTGVNAGSTATLIAEAREALGSYWREFAYSPDGKNVGDVWTIGGRPNRAAHFAVYPAELIRRPILATVPEGGTVLDPFFGSGTTGVVAQELGRRCVGVELNPDHCELSASGLRQPALTEPNPGSDS